MVMSMIKILHIINGLGSGGAENFIINIYRNIDTTKIQFDFLIKTEDLFHKNEIEEKGGKIYIMPPFPKKALRNLIETKIFLNRHSEYDAIHIHSSSLAYFVPLLSVNKHSNIKIILHSHSTDAGSKSYRILHYFNRRFLVSKTDYRLACSEKAGKWMFGNKDFTVVPNAIDINKFLFSEHKRNIIRKKYKIADSETVVGHVGRFLPVKNHIFIIRVFREYLKINPNSRLMLVGSGPLMDEIKNEAFDIKEKIIFTGEVNNVDAYLAAFDIFIFPSIYEGLGIALIEAQATGVPCLATNTIPEEAFVLDNVLRYSLEDSEIEWASGIDELLKIGKQADVSELYTRGYDITDMVEKLSGIYRECRNGKL